MSIGVASDHAGFRYKTLLAEHLRALGHDVEDFGAPSEVPVDYPDFIRPCAIAVAEGRLARAFVFGGSGNGEAMAANRVRGVRCAVAWDLESARLSRLHNDANVLSIGQRLVPEAQLLPIADLWLATAFEGGRHAERIRKLDLVYGIRPARPAEAEELTRLARDAKASWGYPAEWLDAWREELTITAEYLQRNQVFVADTGDGLAGVAALERVRGVAVLEHVWVAVRHQRQGIGEALVRHALTVASEAGDRTVRVTSDPQALGFYERLGGRLTGNIPAPMPGMPERVLPVLDLMATPNP
jgi:ribose 5-phosphate isomerase B